MNDKKPSSVFNMIKYFRPELPNHLECAKRIDAIVMKAEPDFLADIASLWFVEPPTDTTTPQGSQNQDDCPNDIHPQIWAMLKTIRVHEGTSAPYGYRVMFGGTASQPLLFDNGFADHPRQINCVGVAPNQLCSDAAGAYQFLSTTWDTVAAQLGLPNFMPHYQDQAAVQLIRNRGVYDEVIAGHLDVALDELSWEWASLPSSHGDGRYGQPSTSVEDIYDLFVGYGGVVGG